MALKILKTRTLPIGIDLGTTAVKMAQLRCVQGQLALIAAGAAEVPPSPADALDERLGLFGERLRHLQKANAFKGRQCVLALPAAATFVQHVKTVKASGPELDQALYSELEGKLPFHPAEAVIRHIVVGEIHHEHEVRQEIIVAAAARQVVEDHLEMMRRSKLEVLALDIEPCAILECFARLFRRAQDGHRVTLFLDLGQAFTQVVISHGAKLVFARNVPMGARQIEGAAGAALGIGADEVQSLRIRAIDSDQGPPEAERVYQAMNAPLETFIGEITKCRRYYESVFPSNPVSRAIFLGGLARDRRLCQRMAQQLNLPAQIGDPLARVDRVGEAGVEVGLDRREAQPAWAVAVGLSLGAQAPKAA